MVSAVYLASETLSYPLSFFSLFFFNQQLNALNFLAFPGLGRTKSLCFAVRICSLSQSIRYSDSEGSPSGSLAILVS